MESSVGMQLLNINCNTVEKVRKELNLHHEGVLEQMITEFENWIIKQNHFTKKKFDRHYLEASIIMAKGSLERAKHTLDRLCTLKTLLPQFFCKYDAKTELIDSTGFIIGAVMPHLLEDNYRLLMTKIVSTDFNWTKFLDFYRLSIMTAEYFKKCDYFHGIHNIVDCRGINMLTYVTGINLVDLRDCMTLLMKGYSIRIKAIHLISESQGVDAFVVLLKQILGIKVASRIIVHKSIESIYEYVPKAVLPADYGGEEKPLKELHDDWINVLSSKENVAFIKEMFQAGTDEKCRLPEDYNNQILGMPGSFRKLVVD